MSEETVTEIEDSGTTAAMAVSAGLKVEAGGATGKFWLSHR